MLLKALDEQRRQLKEHEGSNHKLEKKIEKEKRWAEKLDAARADKEARRKGWEVGEGEEGGEGGEGGGGGGGEKEES